jgi:hypothetical protein
MTLIFAGFKYYGIVINKEFDLNERIGMDFGKRLLNIVQ